MLQHKHIFGSIGSTLRETSLINVHPSFPTILLEHKYISCYCISCIFKLRPPWWQTMCTPLKRSLIEWFLKKWTTVISCIEEQYCSNKCSLSLIASASTQTLGTVHDIMANLTSFIGIVFCSVGTYWVLCDLQVCDKILTQVLLDIYTSLRYA